MDVCSVTEDKYRLISKNSVFKNIQYDLLEADSNRFCAYANLNNISDANCTNYLDGFYNIGVSNIIQAYLKNIN